MKLTACMIVVALGLAGCGKANATVSTPAAPAVEPVAEPKPVQAAAPVLAVEREKILAQIELREKGIYQFERQAYDGKSRWLGTSSDLPLTIILNENKTGQIESVDLSYTVVSSSPASTRVRVAGVYSAIVSSVIGPGFQRDALKCFVECMGREQNSEHSDARLTITLNGVDLAGKYSAVGKFHDWTFQASTRNGP